MIEKNYCQHIGIITGYDSGVTAKQRLAGYQEALSSHDMPFEEKYILSTPGYNIDSGNLMNKWLQEKPELDGIMCVTDDIAYYLYRKLEKVGKRVGKDIMVSGFDDKPESTHMVPPLASCHADAYDLYKNASTQNRYIDAHFILRLSVDCENHEEIEIGEFIRFCRAEKESNEYIAQGMTQYVFDNKLVYSSNYQETVWSFFTYLIDRVLIQKALSSNYERSILIYIIEMAHSLRLNVCIEGVETEEEFQEIKKLNPDYIQGYLFGKPAPEDEFYNRQIKKK